MNWAVGWSIPSSAICLPTPSRAGDVTRDPGLSHVLCALRGVDGYCMCLQPRGGRSWFFSVPLFWVVLTRIKIKCVLSEKYSFLGGDWSSLWAGDTGTDSRGPRENPSELGAGAAGRWCPVTLGGEPSSHSVQQRSPNATETPFRRDSDLMEWPLHHPAEGTDEDERHGGGCQRQGARGSVHGPLSPPSLLSHPNSHLPRSATPFWAAPGSAAQRRPAVPRPRSRTVRRNTGGGAPPAPGEPWGAHRRDPLCSPSLPARSGPSLPRDRPPLPAPPPPLRGRQRRAPAQRPRAILRAAAPSGGARCPPQAARAGRGGAARRERGGGGGPGGVCHLLPGGEWRRRSRAVAAPRTWVSPQAQCIHRAAGTTSQAAPPPPRLWRSVAVRLWPLLL